MTSPTQNDLVDAIADGARKAFSSLFQDKPGYYYYCSLITTGEALPPALVAWSYEALAAATASDKNPEAAQRAMKWSYGDSPFFCYGKKLFEKVNSLFRERPQLTHELSNEQWEAEYQFRLDAMEAAMALLDREGVFGTGAARLRTVVLVEVMPPDFTNTERAMRLNPPEALKEWLQEAAEKEEYDSF
jgi:hypothetical protein